MTSTSEPSVSNTIREVETLSSSRTFVGATSHAFSIALTRVPLPAGRPYSEPYPGLTACSKGIAKIAKAAKAISQLDLLRICTSPYNLKNVSLGTSPVDQSARGLISR